MSQPLVMLTATPETLRRADRDGKLTAGFVSASNRAIGAAAAVGAEVVSLGLTTQKYRLHGQRAGAGVAGGMKAWPVDAAAGLYAMGIPAEHPSCFYARLQNEGIRPTHARMLAIPISAEARGGNFRSPRDMPNLTFAKSASGKGLLVERSPGGKRSRGRTIVHWVLVAAVTVAIGWWDEAVADATPQMVESYRADLASYVAPGGAGGGKAGV